MSQKKHNRSINIFFSFKTTALITAVASIVNIAFWEFDYIENIVTGYTVNPNATMKVITGISFMLLGLSYFFNNKNLIKTIIATGLTIQLFQVILILMGIEPEITSRFALSSKITIAMFYLFFLALYFIRVKRRKNVFLILNGILYFIACFSVFYYLLDMEELLTIPWFETLSWNTSILFFMNSISLFEYKLIKRLNDIKFDNILMAGGHPYQYYPFIFLVPILIIALVSVFTYFKVISIAQGIFLIVLLLSAGSFINMFMYSYNYIRFYEKINEKAQQLETKNSRLSNLNERLKSLNKKIKNKNAYLEDFATITSHSLREPIVALSELHKLTDYSSKEEGLDQTELKKMYNASIHRLSQGIDTLIQYHNFIKNEDKPKKETTLLSVSLKQTYKKLEHLRPKNTSISVDISHDISLTKSYIDDIFKNLITNSFKYKKESEPLKLKIIAYKTNKYYKILYRDNGIGIDLVKNKLNMFKKAKRFHEKSRSSSGYGLYYTKLNVEKLNASIDIYSSPGKGAAFRIQIKTNNE